MRTPDLNSAREPEAFDRLTFHAAPQPARGAAFSDWPRFLGPTDNAASPETGLLKTWPAAGPAKVWEVEKGSSFAAPIVVWPHVLLFHRWQDKETLECLEAETGKRRWIFQRAAPYRDRYGSGEGPRTSPVVSPDGRVFLFGITGLLDCLDLATGQALWSRDLAKEFAMGPNFFGHGSNPLVMDGRVIINLGGKGNLSVAAFDTANGKLIWGAKHPWGASYASPVPATIHGRKCVLVFAGGESRPPTGGLLCIDQATGEVLSATPHRADIAESVNASSPVFCPPNRVFVTESYGSGGAMIEIAPDFSATRAWEAPKFGAYFMTPVAKDGCLYGFDGQSPRLAELVGYDIASGKELWRDDLGSKYGRGSLLAADGAFLCLGEFGDLASLDLSAKGAAVMQHAKLFNAPDTWTLPALSHGLLFVCQNERSSDGKPPHFICYDLRGQ